LALPYACDVNGVEAARIASSLKAAAADSGVAAEMPADDLS
jgi:hypothetical protein